MASPPVLKTAFYATVIEYKVIFEVNDISNLLLYMQPNVDGILISHHYCRGHTIHGAIMSPPTHNTVPAHITCDIISAIDLCTCKTITEFCNQKLIKCTVSTINRSHAIMAYQHLRYSTHVIKLTIDPCSYHIHMCSYLVF